MRIRALSILLPLAFATSASAQGLMGDMHRDVNDVQKKLVDLAKARGLLPHIGATFPLGETIELQHDANVIRQHRDLDLAAQAAQAERHHSLPQFRCAADVAAFVKRDADFKPPVRHWVSSRIVPKIEAVHRMPCSLWGRICPDSD